MQQCSFDRNIVQFYGFCPSPPMLVLEFMEARPACPPTPRPYPSPTLPYTQRHLRFCATPGGSRSAAALPQPARAAASMRWVPSGPRAAGRAATCGARCGAPTRPRCSGTRAGARSRWTSRAACTSCTSTRRAAAP